MKTKEELNALKAEVEAVSKKKFKELTEEELAKVVGGDTIGRTQKCINMNCADYGKEFDRALRICPTCNQALF